MNNKNVINIINYIINYLNLLNESNNIFNTVDNYGNTPLHLVIKQIIKNKTILTDININLIKILKANTNLNIVNKEEQKIANLLKLINFNKY